MRGFAAQPILSVWYAHLKIEDAIAEYKAGLSARRLKERKARLKATEAALAKARTRDSLQAIGKLTAIVDGKRQIINQFTLADVAHKVVGVGSVGTRAWILLLEAGVEGEALLLQAKQAGPSALADYAGESEYPNDGERVVAGQHLMQASSDIFLGWLRARPTGERNQGYYLRQLRGLEQNERDHAALSAAVAAGRIEAQSGL